MEKSRLTYLLEGYASRSLSAAGEAELLALLENEPLQAAAEIEAGIALYSRQPYITEPEALQPLMEQVVAIDRPPAIVRRTWPLRRIAAAAAILLAAGTATFYLLRPAQRQQIAHAPAAPRASKAILTLADGTTIELDSNGNQVLHQGNTEVKQSNGQLAYSEGAAAGAISYNTLQTPRGVQFRLSLPDGTTVWLNAASALKYPVAFSKKERVVELSGEAYFEIAQKAGQPFTVKVNDGSSIDVLGTTFNMSAYPDDKRNTATLLAGAIRVNNGRNAAILKPGQQATMTASGDISVIQQPNTEKVIAWKNGLFNFEGASLQDVMKELERWYNIEVVYEKGIPDLHFGGEMSRKLALPEVLKALQDANVHFRLEQGKRLVVMP